MYETGSEGALRRERVIRIAFFFFAPFWPIRPRRLTQCGGDFHVNTRQPAAMTTFCRCYGPFTWTNCGGITSNLLR